ncbi:MAG TPA: DUF4082 domain-containing protein, partial [Terriglobia bacterium]|nr:DUF4082 domain-containing protein [Terriglobia bacterium]
MAAGSVAALAASLPAAAASLWTNTASPAIPSIPGSPFELGVKFQSDTAGYITALRFYKCSANTGRHVGHLWSGTGTLLASAVFTSESASGWQQVTLSTPVAIQAHTTYVASYWDPTGYHSANRYYFRTTYNKPPLHALGDGVSGSNGVYRMGSSGFPALTSESSNYWVDVVFTPSSPAGSPQAPTRFLTATPASLNFGNTTVGT